MNLSIVVAVATLAGLFVAVFYNIVGGIAKEGLQLFSISFRSLSSNIFCFI
jgi:hypothetical protein